VELQARLRRGQASADGVMDEIEQQGAARPPVAEGIQAEQGSDAAFERALAALLVDVLFEVAGQARHDAHAVAREKLRRVLLAGLVKHGEVTAIDHAPAQAGRRLDQKAEARAELGRAAGDVDQGDARILLEHAHDLLGDRPRHDLGALRSRLDVAVVARHVAALADVHLQGAHLGAPERRQRPAHEVIDEDVDSWHQHQQQPPPLHERGRGSLGETSSNSSR
jgi:hypothetical protein